MRRLVLPALLIGISLPIVGLAQTKNKKSLRIEGVTEYFGIRYLPEWRYTGDPSDRGDVEMTLDIFTPQGQGPFPTVIYVHGGGYGGGSNLIAGSNRQFAVRLLEEGFVVVSLNYILQSKGIFPQVWWDFRDSVRFLRINADKYKIDPRRIGAYGLSAGGWLITSATAGNGDLIRTNNSNAITTHELKELAWRRRVKDHDHPDNWLRPMRDPSPEYQGVHGGVSALSFDFDHHLQYAQPYNVFLQKWVGDGYTPKFWKDVQASMAEANFEFARMPWERHKNKPVHVPPLYPQNEREHGKAMAIDGQGQEKPLGEVVLDFFRRRLVDDCRLPEPEVYPVPRVFSNKAQVSIVGPPQSVVYFTTDGSEPTTSSLVYTKPFTIREDTVVKAVAASTGYSTSGASAAHFVQGEMPPIVIGPEALPGQDPIVLPQALTGKRFEVRFTANIENARWLIQGELVPHLPRNAANTVFPNNMSLDSETEVWSGTPFKPGTYWIQVWANRGDGTLASHKNYRWIVKGKELPGNSWTVAATDLDTNVRIARLIASDGWGRGHIGELHRRLRQRGVKYFLLGEKDEDKFLIVDQRDRITAQDCIESVRSRYRSLVEKVEYYLDK